MSERELDTKRENRVFESEKKDVFADMTGAAAECARRLGREAILVGGGLVFGTAKRISENPAAATAGGASAVLGGALMGGLIAAELPVLSRATAVVAAGATLCWLQKMLDPGDPANQVRSRVLAKSIKETWDCSDDTALNRHLPQVERQLGPLGVELIVASVAGAAGGLAARFMQHPSIGRFGVFEPQPCSQVSKKVSPEGDLPLTEARKSLTPSELLLDASLNWRQYENGRYLGMHEKNLAYYAEAVSFVKTPAKGFAGAGGESVAIELEPPAQLFARSFKMPERQERFSYCGELERAFEPSVLKITKPLRHTWNDDWGHRPFDARLVREPQEFRLRSGDRVYVYVQEKCGPLYRSEEDPDVLDFLDKIRCYPGAKCGDLFMGGHWLRKDQLGVNSRGRIVLIDYPSVLTPLNSLKALQ